VVFDEVSNPRHCTLLSRRLWQKFIWSDNPFIAFNLKTTFQKLNNDEEEKQLLPLKPWDRFLNRSQCFKSNWRCLVKLIRVILNNLLLTYFLKQMRCFSSWLYFNESYSDLMALWST
jgi:hypothetical protein